MAVEKIIKILKDSFILSFYLEGQKAQYEYNQKYTKNLLHFNNEDNFRLVFSGKHSRRAIIFIKLFIFSSMCIIFFWLFKKKSKKINDVDYLAYPSIHNPQLLIQLTNIKLDKNYPFLFSQRRLINYLHFWCILTINNYSFNTEIRNILFKLTGIGMLKIEGLSELSNNLGNIIQATKEKNIFFIGNDNNYVFKVVSWHNFINKEDDKKITSNIFEVGVHASFFQERYIKVSKYHKGEPIHYDIDLFDLCINKLMKIQNMTSLKETYDLGDINDVLIRYKSQLGLSKSDLEDFLVSFKRLFKLKPRLFEKKYIHGDFVPKNILHSNNDFNFIDSSELFHKGFFATDFSSLVFSILVGEPYKSDIKSSFINLNNFQQISKTIRLKYNLSESDIKTSYLIGLLEKILISEKENRISISKYWAQILKVFIKDIKGQG